MISLSPETELLAERVADARHVTVDDAVRQALEILAQAAGILLQPAGRPDHSPEAAAARRDRVTQIVNEIAAMPIRDPRSPQQIMDDLNTL